VSTGKQSRIDLRGHDFEFVYTISRYLMAVNQIKTLFITECCKMKITFGELKRICGEVVVVLFKLLFWHLRGALQSRNPNSHLGPQHKMSHSLIFLHV
jgi:hypothetical protein